MRAAEQEAYVQSGLIAFLFYAGYRILFRERDMVLSRAGAGTRTKAPASFGLIPLLWSILIGSKYLLSFNAKMMPRYYRI